MAELSSSPEIEAFLTFLAVERGRSPRTIDSYRRDFKALEKGLRAESSSIKEATAAELDQQLASLRRQGRSAATVARARSSMRGLYRFLADEGVIDEDPTVTTGSLRVPARLPKALSEAEVIDLLEGISGDDPLALRDRALLELLYGTGARVSEAVGLDLEDLAYDEGLLRVVGKGAFYVPGIQRVRRLSLDIHEAELDLASEPQLEDNDPLSTPMPPLERRLILARLVQAWAQTVDRTLLRRAHTALWQAKQTAGGAWAVSREAIAG